ncbi:folylpolyglutamate synthase [Serendipita sp. 399]|nr:folylpolyglutamate synthase [Serendipita sp. 399]
MWVGHGNSDGLERGREVLAKWGFRRCEDIVWVKTNKTSNSGPGTDPPPIGGIMTRTTEHCLMGIRGTVRRSNDGWFVHCNIDTDVIIWEGDPTDALRKPPEMYSLIENFCLGTRRLELFGRASSLRRGWVTVGDIDDAAYELEKVGGKTWDREWYDVDIRSKLQNGKAVVAASSGKYSTAPDKNNQGSGAGTPNNQQRMVTPVNPNQGMQYNQPMPMMQQGGMGSMPMQGPMFSAPRPVPMVAAGFDNGFQPGEGMVGMNMPQMMPMGMPPNVGVMQGAVINPAMAAGMMGNAGTFGMGQLPANLPQGSPIRLGGGPMQGLHLPNTMGMGGSMVQNPGSNIGVMRMGQADQSMAMGMMNPMGMGQMGGAMGGAAMMPVPGAMQMGLPQMQMNGMGMGMNPTANMGLGPNRMGFPNNRTWQGGSVTALVASILHDAGLKVGRFNSPHLLHARDSISIGLKPVSERRYSETRAIVNRANEESGKGEEDAPRASLFEALTVTAFRIFEEEAVDIAVIEVGMGGRLDSTNILPDVGVVKVSAMTEVDVDHVQWLGSTVAEIAREKAGIARKGVPFVLGPQKRKEVADIVKDSVEATGGHIVSAPNLTARRPTAHESDVSPQTLPPPSTIVQYQPPDEKQPLELTLPLHGNHQVNNLSTALGIVECLRQRPEYVHKISNASIIRGVKNTRWPGRIEFFRYKPSIDRSTMILADGAHNNASAASLRRYIDELKPGRVSFILALSQSPSKDPIETLEPLLRPADRAYMVPFSSVEDMSWVKPVNTTEMATIAKGLVGEKGWIFTHTLDDTHNTPDGMSTLTEALDLAAIDSDLVVVAGSLYLIADLYRLQGAKPDVLFSL